MSDPEYKYQEIPSLPNNKILLQGLPEEYVKILKLTNKPVKKLVDLRKRLIKLKNEKEAILQAIPVVHIATLPWGHLDTFTNFLKDRRDLYILDHILKNFDRTKELEAEDALKKLNDEFAKAKKKVSETLGISEEDLEFEVKEGMIASKRRREGEGF